MIEIFLHSRRPVRDTDQLDTDLRVVDGRLRLQMSGLGIDVAWYAPDGSVQAKIGHFLGTMTTTRTINALAELLGIPDRVEREGTEVGQGSRFTYAGSYVDIDQVFTLAGPLTMRAWRAARV